MEKKYSNMIDCYVLNAYDKNIISVKKVMFFISRKSHAKCLKRVNNSFLSLISQLSTNFAFDEKETRQKVIIFDNKTKWRRKGKKFGFPQRYLLD